MFYNVKRICEETNKLHQCLIENKSKMEEQNKNTKQNSELHTTDTSHSGYVCRIGKERVFIIAGNIAQAMDKMEEITGDSIFGYSIESHSSIRAIYCD